MLTAQRRMCTMVSGALTVTKNRENASHVPAPEPKMFRDWTKPKLFRAGTVPETVPVQSLLDSTHYSLFLLFT